MFNPIFNFGDKIRHSNLALRLAHSYLQKYDDDNIYKTHYPFKDNVALVYSGGKSAPFLTKLLDASKFDFYPDKRFNSIEPDFMLFRNNKFLLNKNETRVLGQPDLIVEIWSDSNDENERSFKHNLYSSSEITEHWYITQDSNEVICYLGETLLSSQYLNKLLITQSGLEFDLRRLAL